MLNINKPFTVTASSSNTSALGYRNLKTEASSMGPASNGTNTFNIIPTNSKSSILDGLMNVKSDQINDVFRDIYWHDTIAGAAVDLMSVIPFSDFSLINVNDPGILKTYASTVENINVRSLAPALTTDYYVIGKFIGAFHYENQGKSVRSIIPFNADACAINPTPIYGYDPIIDVSFPREYKKFIDSKDPRFLEVGQHLPKWMVEGIKEGKVLLDNLSSLYIPRATFSSSDIGTSLYKRILPIYLLEKALLKGTIASAYRRQRPIGHITAGDDEWEPTNEELQAITNLFVQADADPIGAFVATRNAVQYQDIRSGQDLWKYEESYDFASSAKMRALGINESFLTGESNYSTLETALSIFIEQVSSYRDLITRKLFYDKLFPTIAYFNGFKKKFEVTANNEHLINAYKGFMDGSRDHMRWSGKEDNRYLEAVCTPFGQSSMAGITSIKDINITEYEMPTVRWHKQLKPRGDREYMELLTMLSERQIPIPLRMLAAAAGVDMGEIMSSLDMDLQDRTDLKSYFTKVASLNPAGAGEEGGAGFEQNWSMTSHNNSTRKNRSEITPRMIKVQGSRIKDMTKDEVKHVDYKANKNITKAAQRIFAHMNKKQNEQIKEEAKRRYY